MQDARSLYLRPAAGGALMGRNGAVTTGRTDTRRSCATCGLRVKVGEPKAQDTWPARLSLNREQLDLLLVAAAEYRDLCEEAGEYNDAISFLDWVAPEALSPSYASPVNAQREAASAANRTPLRLHSTSKKVAP